MSDERRASNERRSERRRRARRHALRAAAAVAGITALASGCASPPRSNARDTGYHPRDAGPHDAGPDANVIGWGADDDDPDAAFDANFAGDAGCDELIPTNELCCLAGAGTWWVYDGGYAECFIWVPGPFVPPVDAREGVS